MLTVEMRVTRLVRRLLASLLLSVLAAAPGAGQATAVPAAAGSVHGRVSGRFGVDVVPLSFALVEVMSRGIRRVALADSAGRYVVSGLHPGEVRLSVAYAGYEPLSLLVEIPARESVALDLELPAAPVALPGVRVETVGTSAYDTSEVSGTSAPAADVEMLALNLGPGVGQPGLADAISALPGNDPADATDVLFMRGSTTDLKLVLLDGVPVYTPFHVGGLMRSFEPGVLGSADLHVGGAPASFDGGLTHILELRTRSPRRDRMRVSGSVDLLTASGAVEAPLGTRAGILVAGRSLHDLGTAALPGTRPYGYRDLLVTTGTDLAEGHELRATGFWNEESVVLDYDQASDDATWANRAGSLEYRADLSGVELDLTAGASGYRAELPLQPAQQPGEPPPTTLVGSAATDRVRLLGEVTWGAASAPVRAGLSFDGIGATFRARTVGGGANSSSHGSTRVAGAFLDATRPLAAGVSLRAGVRADHFTGDHTRLAPRVALIWELGPDALLTVAAGRYHQATRAPDVEVERTLAEVAVDGVPAAELLPVATSDHVVLSLDQRLAGTVRLGLEGFWKGYEDLPSSLGRTVRSSGIDVRVYRAGERGAAWLGYSLSWFWSTVDLSGHTSDFAGRHLLSAGMTRRLGGFLRAEARVAYGAGLPYTSIPFGSGARSSDLSTVSAPDSPSDDVPLVGGLDEAFLRVDLEVHALLQPTWGGHLFRVQPYLRVLNALDRRDALFYTFQPWRSQAVRPLAEQPLIPLVGVAVSF